MTAAARQRRYRRRQRDGLIVLRVSVDHVSIAEALIAAGLLASSDYDNRDAIARALERAVVVIQGRDA